MPTNPEIEKIFDEEFFRQAAGEICCNSAFRIHLLDETLNDMAKDWGTMRRLENKPQTLNTEENLEDIEDINLEDMRNFQFRPAILLDCIQRHIKRVPATHPQKLECIRYKREVLSKKKDWKNKNDLFKVKEYRFILQRMENILFGAVVEHLKECKETFLKLAQARTDYSLETGFAEKFNQLKKVLQKISSSACGENGFVAPVDDSKIDPKMPPNGRGVTE